MKGKNNGLEMIWTRNLIQILKWQGKWKTRKVWQLKHKNEINEHKQQFWFCFFLIYIFFFDFFFVRCKSEWWTRRIWYLWTFGPFKRNLALIPLDEHYFVKNVHIWLLVMNWWKLLAERLIIGKITQEIDWKYCEWNDVQKEHENYVIGINFDNYLCWKRDFGFELVFRLISGIKQEMEWRV